MDNDRMEQQYTITVFTENIPGLLQRVVSIFTRRHINIDSLNTSRSSKPDIYRYTIVVSVSEAVVKKLVAQLEKQVEVLKAFYYLDDELVYQELALYKVPTELFMANNQVEKLVREYNAHILEIEKDFTVIEKTGHPNETEALLRELEAIGIYEFVRSGRIAIVKPMERLNTYLKEMEQQSGPFRQPTPLP